MDWQDRLARRAIAARHEDHDHLVDVSLDPAYPPEYRVGGLVAVTFRTHARARGGFVYATAIDVPAALGLGARLGLDEAEALAFVDSHERVHVQLQLAGVDEDAEEDAARLVDAVWLSLRHPRAAEAVHANAAEVVTQVREGFWERLVDAGDRTRR